MGRRKYNWGKSQILRDLEVGESVVIKYESKGDYEGWRSVALHLYPVFGVRFTFRHIGKTITIKRTI